MLQDYYEKHNLEMKPYEYYLAEFQNVNPEGVTSRLDIPFDDNSKSFIIKFMQNTWPPMMRIMQKRMFLKKVTM